MKSCFSSTRSRYFLIPLLGSIALVTLWGRELSNVALLIPGTLLVASVFTAVHHAEVVALKVGEPFGSLILALSVTVIEVGLIVVLLLESPESNQNLARDTVFAAVMITTNGIVGIALLVKTLRQREAIFNAQGVGGALASLATLSVLSLVLPTVTTSTPGPTFTAAQLIFAAVISLLLYVTFVAVQTVRHRDFFLPPPREDQTIPIEAHVSPPSRDQAVRSLIGLLISLITVVGLAKICSPIVQDFVDTRNLPQMMVAIVIAMIVLLPESISAIKAARYGRTQTSLNLAYGSALASIGLTIPAIAIITNVFSYNINLGLNAVEIALLALTFFVSTLTVVQGRATLLQSIIHLSILGSFVMFAASP